MLLVPFLLATALSSPLPAFDEGYDLLVLELPRTVVAGSTLPFEVRGRPGNPFVVFIDGIKGQPRRIGNAWIHLSLGPSMLPVAFGLMPGTGRTRHALGIPALPALHGVQIFVQAFGEDHSAFRGFVGSDSKTVTLEREAKQPLIRLVTVNRIPADMNGSEPREGWIVVPQTGFSIDVLIDDRGKSPLDPATLVVTADKDLAGGKIKAGTNLASFFKLTGSAASGLVDSKWAFPLKTFITLKAKIKNKLGVAASQRSYRVWCDAFPSWAKPFATKHLWVLDFVTSDLDRSGVPDYAEDLVLYGLGSDARAKSGPSFDVRAWSYKAVQAALRRNYGVGSSNPVNVDFLLAPPPSRHATICVGGRNKFPVNQLPPGAQETTGAAYFNRRNQIKNYRICGGVLGVHPRSIFFLFRNVPAFKTVFGPLMQTPVGKHKDDAVVTKPGFDPTKGTASQKARYAAIKAGVEAFANATGFVLTQETGHAMGMVASGLLPLGQLGSPQLGHSTSFHFDDGLGNFMSGNNSTPAPAKPANLALVWGHFQSGRGHFTALNWAYLRQRIIN